MRLLQDNTDITLRINEHWLEITNKKSGLVMEVMVAGNAIVGRISKPKAATITAVGAHFMAGVPEEDGTLETPPYLGNNGEPVSVLRAEGYQV